MTRSRYARLLLAAGLLPLAACVRRPADEHAGHVAPAAAPATATAAATVTPLQPASGLPASAAHASARLAQSPRHGEWVMVPLAPGSADSVRAWIVYPERATKAPVVIVVHEIFGLTTWVRGVADQLAAEGFIAVAPDYLTGLVASTAADNLSMEEGRAAMQKVSFETATRQTQALARWASTLPAASGRWGIVGFCWGGSMVWRQAVAAGERAGAGVVYYGTLPNDVAPALADLRAPILGLYGGNDARVNATIPSTDSLARSLGKSYEKHVHEGAGHGFLRQQEGMEGANMRASEAAWPRTIAFFRQHLGA